MSAHTNDAGDRTELLRELGYGHPEAQVAAIEVLIAAGQTNARNKGIAAYKREQCRAVPEGAPRAARTVQVRRGGVEDIANELVDHLKKRK